MPAAKKLTKNQIRDVYQELTPVVDLLSARPEELGIISQKLSFYPDCELLEVSEPESKHGQTLSFIYKKGEFCVALDGQNETIYELNKKTVLVLSEESAADYIRFFFAHVKGRKGKFRLIEEVEDIPWRESPPPAGRQAIGTMIKPVFPAKDKSDGWQSQVTFLFVDSLFSAKVHVLRDGHVEISDEDLLIENMPVFTMALEPAD